MGLDTNNSILLTDTLSKNTLLPGESKKSLYVIREELRKDLEPVGALAEIIFSKIVNDVWELKRLLKTKTQILKDQQKSTLLERLNNSHRLTNLEPVKRKRFRTTVYKIVYTPELEDLQKVISSVEAGLLKTVSEFLAIQKNRLQK